MKIPAISTHRTKKNLQSEYLYIKKMQKQLFFYSNFLGGRPYNKIYFFAHFSDKNKTFVTTIFIFNFFHTCQILFLHVSDQDK